MHTHAWNRSLATNSSELRPVLRERALGRVLLFLTFFCVSIGGVRPLIRYDRKIFGVTFFLLSSGSPRKRTTSVIVTGNFKFCLRKNLSIILRSDINRNAFLTQRHLMVPFEALSTLFLVYHQGHPMDLFLTISVHQANFCWLGIWENDVSVEGNCCLEIDK